MHTLIAIRNALLGGAVLALVLFAAFAGFGLGMGIMAYHAIVDGTDYTWFSWALIPPTWALLALLWLLMRRSLVAAIPLGAVALFAAWYYSDVYGQYPAIAVFFLTAAIVFLPRPDDRGTAGDVAGANVAERARSST